MFQILNKAYFVCIAYLILVNAKVSARMFSWPQWGRCPDVDPQKPFDLQAFQGQWFLQAGCNIEDLTPATNCASIMFNLTSQSGKPFYQFQGKGESKGKGESRKIIPVHGSASLVNTTGDTFGSFTVTFSDDIYSSILPILIFTDYSHYAIAYSCKNILGFLHISSIWIASARQELNKEDKEVFMKMVWSVLNTRNIAPTMVTPYNPNECKLTELNIDGTS